MYLSQINDHSSIASPSRANLSYRKAHNCRDVQGHLWCSEQRQKKRTVATCDKTNEPLICCMYAYRKMVIISSA